LLFSPPDKQRTMAEQIKKPQTKTLEKDNTNKTVLGITLVLAGLYYFYSTKSKGFYQQDEAAHFLNMLDFWYTPNEMLGNWAKPGYKVLFALPALLGKNFVAFVNCLVAAFSAYFAYLTAKNLKAGAPWMAFVLLATQPFWISLSFRNYSEFITAFLLIVGVYFYTKNKHIFAALLLSYCCTIRQEFYPILAIYGLVLLIGKNWVPMLLLALFPLLQNLWGYLASGDPIYLYNQILGGSAELKDIYPRQGFDHYLKTLHVVFGPVALTLALVYLSWCVLAKKQPNWVLVVPVFLFILINCLFNWQAYPIGPSTGGNLRYMCVIAPLVAVMAALGASELHKLPQSYKVLYALVPFAFITYVWLGYKHNFIMLTDEPDPTSFIGVALASALVFLPVKNNVQAWSLSGLSLFFILLTVKALPLGEEDKACKQLAEWYKVNEKQFSDRPKFINHTMFYYWLDKNSKSFNPVPKQLSPDSLATAKPGTLVFWDSHYSFRPARKTGVDLQYFAQNQGKYNLLHEIRSPSNNFAAFVFEVK